MNILKSCDGARLGRVTVLDRSMRRLAIGIALAWVGAAGAQLPREVSISTFSDAEAVVRPMEQVVVRAYARLGIKASVVRLPVARSLIDADNGKYDAELGRTSYGEKDFSHLVRVPEPVGEIAFAPFVMRGSTVTLKDWNALKQSGLHIGTRFGVRVPEAMLGSALTERPNSTIALVRMLIAGRVDVIVSSSLGMRLALAKMRREGVPGVADVMELTPLDVQTVYHYLHERHRALITPLNAEIKRLKQEGTMQTIWEAAAKEEM